MVGARFSTKSSFPRQASKQTDRQTDRWTDRHAGRQAGRPLFRGICRILFCEANQLVEVRNSKTCTSLLLGLFCHFLGYSTRKPLPLQILLLLLYHTVLMYILQAPTLITMLKSRMFCRFSTMRQTSVVTWSLMVHFTHFWTCPTISVRIGFF